MRPAALLLVPALLGTVSAQQPPREEHSIVTACGILPPRSIAEWKKRADAVMRVRIDSQESFEHDQSSLRPDIVTAHEVTVLEVFKGDSRAGVEGASQRLLQWGGRLHKGDVSRSQTWNNLPPFPIGSEWILFLHWHPGLQGFMPMMLEYGAIEIAGDRIVRAAGVPGDWKGRSREALAAAIRSPELFPPEPMVDLRVPMANRRVWTTVRDAADWRNPFVVVHADRIELTSQSGRRTLPLGELKAALADLSLLSWPYGRIIAVQETALRNGVDDEAIAMNVETVTSVARALKLDVNRWPH